MASQRNGRAGAAASRGSTLVLTNVTKLVGLGLAINEAVVRTTPRDSVIALCALFVLGAQVAENVILRAIDRLLGSPDESQDRSPGDEEL